MTTHSVLSKELHSNFSKFLRLPEHMPSALLEATSPALLNFPHGSSDRAYPHSMFLVPEYHDYDRLPPHAIKSESAGQLTLQQLLHVDSAPAPPSHPGRPRSETQLSPCTNTLSRSNTQLLLKSSSNIRPASRQKSVVDNNDIRTNLEEKNCPSSRPTTYSAGRGRLNLDYRDGSQNSIMRQKTVLSHDDEEITDEDGYSSEIRHAMLQDQLKKANSEKKKRKGKSENKNKKHKEKKPKRIRPNLLLTTNAVQDDRKTKSAPYPDFLQAQCKTLTLHRSPVVKDKPSVNRGGGTMSDTCLRGKTGKDQTLKSAYFSQAYSFPTKSFNLPQMSETTSTTKMVDRQRTSLTSDGTLTLSFKLSNRSLTEAEELALAKVTKVYLSEKQSKNIRDCGKEMPGAPPATPTPEQMKKYEYVPSMNDIRAQRAVKQKLQALEKSAQKKADKVKEEKVRLDKQQSKDREKNSKVRQRLEIYALNKVMTELENKKFLEFCRSNGLNT